MSIKMEIDAVLLLLQNVIKNHSYTTHINMRRDIIDSVRIGVKQCCTFLECFAISFRCTQF